MRRKLNKRWSCAAATAVVTVLLALLPGGTAQALAVKLDADLGTPVVLENTKQSVFMKVRLEGLAIEEKERAPVNVAIVLDKSGSMSGRKIERAKEAAMAAIDQLNAEDIVSIVFYDSTVRVLIPATKVSNRAAIYSAIRGIQSGGNTALFAGVSKGAAEVRKFKDLERVNRVILLSDGLANVGPSSVADLASLGASLQNESIAVSTIGLGLDYNEDLMAQLAERSHGSHLFAEEATDLAQAFQDEFGDVLSAVAQNAVVRLSCAKGVLPVRILGRDGSIEGQNVTVSLGQVYGKQVKYAVIELEVPAGEKGAEMQLGEVHLDCINLESKEREAQVTRPNLRFTDTQAEVDRNMDKKAMVSIVRQVGARENALARKLRDEGKIEQAESDLKSNSSVLIEWSQKLDSEVLREDASFNEADAVNLAPGKWKVQRKRMIQKESKDRLQALGYVD